MSAQAICPTCNATILAATAAKTGGLCMPCFNGTRYSHLAYLSIDEFFSKCSSEYCLAPNLDPHPSNADFKAALTRLSMEPGVSRCVIPVHEYQEPDSELEPYSDRVFVAGSVSESVIESYARELQAEFYQEERPGAEMPRDYSGDLPGWFLVWD